MQMNRSTASCHASPFLEGRSRELIPSVTEYRSIVFNTCNKRQNKINKRWDKFVNDAKIVWNAVINLICLIQIVSTCEDAEWIYMSWEWWMIWKRIIKKKSLIIVDHVNIYLDCIEFHSPPQDHRQKSYVW